MNSKIVSLTLILAVAISTLSALPCVATDGPIQSRHVEVTTSVLTGIDGFKQGIPAAMLACRFGYSEPLPPNRRELPLDSTCLAVNADQSTEAIAERYGATYDTKNNRWAAYFGDVSKEDADLLRLVTRVGPLDAVNGHGFYLTQDDTDGDLPKRTRSLTYCLFHDGKALCGHGQVMKLTDPKGNLLPYALTILRSIELIDTPAPASALAKP